MVHCSKLGAVSPIKRSKGRAAFHKLTEDKKKQQQKKKQTTESLEQFCVLRPF